MDPVVHFEMPADDQKRAADFYGKAFGWHAQHLGPEMANYTVIHTTEMDKDRMPTKPGRINGGIFKRTKSDQYPNVVIAVKDIREAMKKVADAGGTVLGGQKPGVPDDIPGIGLYVSILDTEGNRVGVIQPKEM
ncbi:MAG: glyoxalase/bleomycin resistance protein/dioxygenase [Parcubacteria group bacterium Gr01-1014_8]|nr:MAG: glyoxalase/bleomycin resistance protein/dioxygenase [Parcubacteria group bacterium Gr01-1014_8]